MRHSTPSSVPSQSEHTSTSDRLAAFADSDRRSRANRLYHRLRRIRHVHEAARRAEQLLCEDRPVTAYYLSAAVACGLVERSDVERVDGPSPRYRYR